MRLRVPLLLLVAYSSLSAASLSLFNSGVDAAAVPLATITGSTDIHYQVKSDFNPIFANAITYYNAAYPADGPNSDWISVNANGSDGSTFYTFRTTFTIGSGFNPATATLSGQFAADNHVTSTLLNGNVIPTAITDTYLFFTPFSIGLGSGFVSGTNTLDFVVKDDGAPMALRIDALTGSVNPVTGPGPGGAPEPASLLLLASGVVLIAVRRNLARPSSRV